MSLYSIKFFLSSSLYNASVKINQMLPLGFDQIADSTIVFVILIDMFRSEAPL